MKDWKKVFISSDRAFIFQLLAARLLLCCVFWLSVQTGSAEDLALLL